MFEHLRSDDPALPAYAPPSTSSPFEDFTPVTGASPSAIIDAQLSTAEFLRAMGAPSSKEVVESAQIDAARRVFLTQLGSPETTTEEQRSELLKLNCPSAVRHLVAMLTAYDWEFVEQAQELRGYAVAKILEEVEREGSTAAHRLRALELLGKVTEVGLFTEQVKVTKVDMTDEALDARIKQKLERFRHIIDVTPERGDVVDVTPERDPAIDVTPTDVTEIVQEVGTPQPAPALALQQELPLLGEEK